MNDENTTRYNLPKATIKRKPIKSGNSYIIYLPKSLFDALVLTNSVTYLFDIVGEVKTEPEEEKEVSN